jgi:hypothetical protein
VSDPALAVVFQTLPGANFIVNGAGPAKDSALTSTGTELHLSSGVTLLANSTASFLPLLSLCRTPLSCDRRAPFGSSNKRLPE